MSDSTLHILSSDLSYDTLFTEQAVTVIALTSRMGMWGEMMFGHQLTLGASLSTTYTSGIRNIRAEDFSWNVIRP